MHTVKTGSTAGPCITNFTPLQVLRCHRSKSPCGSGVEHEHHKGHPTKHQKGRKSRDFTNQRGSSSVDLLSLEPTEPEEKRFSLERCRPRLQLAIVGCVTTSTMVPPAASSPVRTPPVLGEQGEPVPNQAEMQMSTQPLKKLS